MLAITRITEEFDEILVELKTFEECVKWVDEHPEYNDDVLWIQDAYEE